MSSTTNSSINSASSTNAALHLPSSSFATAPLATGAARKEASIPAAIGITDHAAALSSSSAGASNALDSDIICIETVNPEHQFYQVLQSRKTALGNKDAKISRIRKISESDIAKSYLVGARSTSCSSAEWNAATIAWFGQTKAALTKTSNYTLPQISKALCELHSIIQFAQQHKKNATIPSEIIEIQSWFNDIVREQSLVHKNDLLKIAKNKRPIGHQIASQPLLQETSYDVNKLKNSQLDQQPCANCNRGNVLPIGLSAIMISKRNAEAGKRYKQEKAAFDRNKSKKDGQDKASRPKKPVLESQELLCLCVISSCLNRSDGVGCLHCQQCVENHTIANPDQAKRNPNLNGEGECECEICSCQCSVKYTRSEKALLARQAQEKREALDNQEEQEGDTSK